MFVLFSWTEVRFVLGVGRKWTKAICRLALIWLVWFPPFLFLLTQLCGLSNIIYHMPNSPSCCCMVQGEMLNPFCFHESVNYKHLLFENTALWKDRADGTCVNKVASIWFICNPSTWRWGLNVLFHKFVLYQRWPHRTTDSPRQLRTSTTGQQQGGNSSVILWLLLCIFHLVFHSSVSRFLSVTLHGCVCLWVHLCVFPLSSVVAVSSEGKVIYFSYVSCFVGDSWASSQVLVVISGNVSRRVVLGSICCIQGGSK